MKQNQSRKNFFRTRLKFDAKGLIILVLFLIALYFLVPKLIKAEEAVKLIIHVNKFYLFLALVVEVFSYCASAFLMGVILSRLTYQVSFLDRFRLSSIAAFAIHFFPLGSYGEGFMEYYFLTKKNVKAGSVLIMLMLRTFLSYVAFFFLFLVGLVLIPTLSPLSFQIKLASALLASLVIWGIWYMFYLYKRRETFWRRWWGFINFINFFIKIIGHALIEKPRAFELFEDIYKGIGLFKRKKRFIVIAFLAALGYWLGDIAALFFVFLSFNFIINPGVLLFGYCVATLAGLISFIPGGLGVTEGSLGLVYAGLGIPLSLALMSILVFRFFSFWIWIPIGLISYLTLKKSV